MIERITGFIIRFSLPIRIFLVLALLTFLIVRIKPDEITGAFKSIEPLYLTLALILMIPNLSLQLLKWGTILGELTPKLSGIIVVKSLLGGFFLGALSPGRVGEIARGIFIPGHSNLKIASLTALDKGLNQITVLLAGLIALTAHLPGFWRILPLIFFAVILFALFNFKLLGPILKKIFNKFISSDKTENLLAVFSLLDKKRIMKLALISVLFYFTYMVQYYCLIRSFTPISPAQALKNLPLIYLINLLLPVGIGDFGVKETAAVFLLGAEGIAGGSAFSATVVNNFMSFVIPSLTGGVLILFAARKKDKIQE
jgi:uncharacterized protein (TIRG00374 family)